MRPVRLSLLLLALTGVGPAQAQVPDTLDPRGYFPLSVGNAWEYEHALHRPRTPERPQDESTTRRERYAILDSSVVGDTTFFTLLYDVRDEEGARVLRDTSRIWYDATEASVCGDRLPGITSWLQCLDAPFWRVGDDEAWECGAWVWIYRDEGFHLPLPGLEAPVTAKTFSSFVYAYSAVHGFGIIGGGGGCEPCSPLDDRDTWTLKYARIDGQEYGARIVYVERPEPLVADAFAAYPNPTRGAITVEVSKAGRLGVFDLLGRRVHAADVEWPGTLTLDLTGQAPGLYVLRFEDRARTIVVL